MREFLRELVPQVGVRTCLRCCFSSDIISTVLRERVGYLKGEEGEHESMCKLMDDLVKDVVKDYRLETAKKMIAFGKNSFEDISKILDIPLSTIEELASSMQKKAGA